MSGEVRSFCVDEFGFSSQWYSTEALAPIQNKVGHFLSSPIHRAIKLQARSTIDLRRIMDEGQVLLVNLSKGLTAPGHAWVDVTEQVASFLKSLPAPLRQHSMRGSGSGRDWLPRHENPPTR